MRAWRVRKPFEGELAWLSGLSRASKGVVVATGRDCGGSFWVRGGMLSAQTLRATYKYVSNAMTERDACFTPFHRHCFSHCLYIFGVGLVVGGH